MKSILIDDTLHQSLKEYSIKNKISMIDVVTQAIKKIVENGVMIYGDGKTPLVLRSIKKKDLGMTEVVHLPEDTKIKRTTYPVLNSTQITEGQPTSKYPSTLNGRPL